MRCGGLSVSDLFSQDHEVLEHDPHTLQATLVLQKQSTLRDLETELEEARIEYEEQLEQTQGHRHDLAARQAEVDCRAGALSAALVSVWSLGRRGVEIVSRMALRLI